MTRQDCNEVIADIVDSARAGGRLSADSRSHLLVCAACADRWESEMVLTAGMSEFRALVRNQPPFGQRSRLRSELLERFDRQTPRHSVRSWWGLAAAAVLLCMVGGGIAYRFVMAPAAEVAAVEDMSDAQTEAQEAGFIAVPYVPPLAQGELVHVVHMQLQPAELASLGVNVDPTLSADMQADILVGEDGFPRAVRISEEATGEGGY